MTRSVLVVVSNCMDCPHGVRVTDPGSADSFDQSDESLCCKISPIPGDARKKTYRGEMFPGRVIVVCERSPSRMREEATIPTWCPLLVEKKK